MISFARAALLASPLFSAVLAHYTVSQDYTGAAFFDGFNFFTGADPNSGHVKFLDKDEANNTGIAGLLQGGLADNAVYLGVDAGNEAAQGRPSIRAESAKSFNRALVVADIVHMPDSTCSVWPAFWMLGPDWPEGGEIDIVEGVNEQTSNQITLHTGSGVSVGNSKSAFSGKMLTPNCDVNAPGQGKNVGCAISDSDSASYGTGFNANGGGIYATEWTSEAIKIWFFTRDKIPADIIAGKPEPGDGWGVPRATFGGNSELDDHFKDLKIIFDTTFCGDWAGALWSQSRCASLAPTCEEFVTKNPEAFKSAYWAINSLKVFQNDDAPPKVKPRWVPRGSAEAAARSIFL